MIKKSTVKTTPMIMEKLNIAPGMKIADIGCGRGYFSFTFAQIVGEEGQVYAVDSKEDRIKTVEEQIHKEGKNNITPILVERAFPQIEDCDVVFLRNSFHHIDNPCEYFKDVQSHLTHNGRIAIIDYKKNILWGKLTGQKHFTVKSELLKIMENAGYSCIGDYSFLPKQLFCVFEYKK